MEWRIENTCKPLSWVLWISSGDKLKLINWGWSYSKWNIIIFQGPLYKQESTKMQKHVKGPPWDISQLFYIAQVLQNSEKLRIWFSAINKNDLNISLYVMTVKTFANINPLGNLSYRMQVLTGKKKKRKKNKQKPY